MQDLKLWNKYINLSERKVGIYKRLYRHLLRKDIYIQTYKNSYANSGATTKSINDTADRFRLEYVESLIDELKSQMYKTKIVNL